MEINQVRPKVSHTGDNTQQTSLAQQNNKVTDNNTTTTKRNVDSESMYDVKSKMFRPFARYPEKQARYEEFMAAKKAGREPVYQYDT